MTLGAKEFGAQDGGKPLPGPIVGQVHGRRSWKADGDGWLRGLSFPQAWRPDGWTEALCLNVKYSSYAYLVSGTYRCYGYDFTDPEAAPRRTGSAQADPCSGLELHCGCGMYVHSGGGNVWWANADDSWRGVVQVEGRIILGPNCMRAQRARIVALAEPRALTTWNKRIEMCERWLAEYREKQFTPPPFPIFMPWRAGTARQAWRKDVANNEVNIQRTESELSRAQSRLRTAERDAQAVRARYSAVPIYRTVEDMFAEWPVSDLGHLLDEPEETA